MPLPRIEPDKPTRATVVFSNGRELTIRLISRPGLGEVLEIQGEGFLCLYPNAPNMVSVGYKVV